MKKTKYIAIAVTALVGLNAKALEIKHNGQFRLRHENYDIYEGRSDKTDFSTMRLRVGMDFKIDEKRRIFISPQAVKNFGEVYSEAQSDGSVKDRTTSGDKFDSPLEFHEAYAEIPLSDIKLKMGRQELAYGDNVILGNRNWTPNGQTFDAVKASIGFAGGELDLVYSKIVDTESDEVNDNDSLLFAYYKAIKTDNLNLDIYVIQHNEALDGVNNDSISYGFRYKQQFGNFGINTENIFQEFNEQEESGYSYNLVIDYKAGKFKPFASYMSTSEDYDQLYTNRHKYNGIIDIVGRKNLDRVSAGTSYKASDKLKLKLEYFQFKKHSDEDLAYNQATNSTLSGDINESDLGSEVDFVLTYSPTKGESFTLGYSEFHHGDYFEEQEVSKFGYLQYLLKF